MKTGTNRTHDYPTRRGNLQEGGTSPGGISPHWCSEFNYNWSTV